MAEEKDTSIRVSSDDIKSLAESASRMAESAASITAAAASMKESAASIDDAIGQSADAESDYDRRVREEAERFQEEAEGNYDDADESLDGKRTEAILELLHGMQDTLDSVNSSLDRQASASRNVATAIMGDTAMDSVTEAGTTIIGQLKDEFDIFDTIRTQLGAVKTWMDANTPADDMSPDMGADVDPVADDAEDPKEQAELLMNGLDTTVSRPDIANYGNPASDPMTGTAFAAVAPASDGTPSPADMPLDESAVPTDDVPGDKDDAVAEVPVNVTADDGAGRLADSIDNLNRTMGAFGVQDAETAPEEPAVPTAELEPAEQPGEQPATEPDTDVAGMEPVSTIAEASDNESIADRPTADSIDHVSEVSPADDVTGTAPSADAGNEPFAAGIDVSSEPEAEGEDIVGDTATTSVSADVSTEPVSETRIDDGYRENSGDRLADGVEPSAVDGMDRTELYAAQDEPGTADDGIAEPAVTVGQETSAGGEETSGESIVQPGMADAAVQADVSTEPDRYGDAGSPFVSAKGTQEDSGSAFRPESDSADRQRPAAADDTVRNDRTASIDGNSVRQATAEGMLAALTDDRFRSMIENSIADIVRRTVGAMIG